MGATSIFFICADVTSSSLVPKSLVLFLLSRLAAVDASILESLVLLALRSLRFWSCATMRMDFLYPSPPVTPRRGGMGTAASGAGDDRSAEGVVAGGVAASTMGLSRSCSGKKASRCSSTVSTGGRTAQSFSSFSRAANDTRRTIAGLESLPRSESRAVPVLGRTRRGVADGGDVALAGAVPRRSAGGDLRVMVGLLGVGDAPDEGVSIWRVKVGLFSFWRSRMGERLDGSS